MNAKISAFAVCVEPITYLLLYNLHDCTCIFLKEKRNSFLQPPKIRCFMSLQHISTNSSKYWPPTQFTGWNWPLIRNLLKIFNLKKTILTLLKILFNTSENLQENQSPKVVLWKDCMYPFKLNIYISSGYFPFHFIFVLKWNNYQEIVNNKTQFLINLASC